MKHKPVFFNISNDLKLITLDYCHHMDVCCDDCD